MVGQPQGPCPGDQHDFPDWDQDVLEALNQQFAPNYRYSTERICVKCGWVHSLTMTDKRLYDGLRAPKST